MQTRRRLRITRVMPRSLLITIWIMMCLHPHIILSGMERLTIFLPCFPKLQKHIIKRLWWRRLPMHLQRKTATLMEIPSQTVAESSRIIPLPCRGRQTVSGMSSIPLQIKRKTESVCSTGKAPGFLSAGQAMRKMQCFGKLMVLAGHLPMRPDTTQMMQVNTTAGMQLTTRPCLIPQENHSNH